MERKVITAEEKTKILREHLENQVTLSELSEKYHVNINSLYNWKKQLFEGAIDIFSGKPQKSSQKDQEKIERMERELQRKDRVIAEIARENIELKKNTNGVI